MIDQEIGLSDRYNPLFELIHGSHPEVDTVICTGGRLSGKSYGVGLAVNEATIQKDWKTLYARFTNVSIKDSIESEFKEKIELLNYEEYYEISSGRASSTVGSGEVVFKGIKTGSGNQTANLKSLSGFNCFVVDEAEEIPDYETFKKVYYSIRSNVKRNLSILILNPTTKDHWIYKKYFENRDVQAGFNGVKGNVLYIHTSYLDLNKEDVPVNIYNDYQLLKKEDVDTYNNIVLGGWVTYTEGSLFIKSELNHFSLKDLRKEDIEANYGYIDVADSGTDSLAYPNAAIVGNKAYITDVVFSKDNIDITMPLCVSQSKELKPEYIQVESNNQGAYFGRELQKELQSSVVIPIHSSSNKMTRIISQYGFIKRYFYFRDDYEAGSPYDLFMQEIYSFNKDPKKNKHDDAPDAISGLSNFINRYLSHKYD